MFASRVLAVAITAAAALPSTPTEASLLGGLLQSETSYLPYEGGRRSLVYTPRGLSGRSPAIVLLHPGGLSLPSAFLNHSELKAVAAANGWRVIVPQGDLLNGWNSGAEGPSRDDVGFVMAQLSQAAAAGLIDPDAVHLAGMSSGAMMGFRLLCEAPGSWRGFTSIVGVPTQVDQTSGGERYSCDDYQPTSVLMINGLADQCVTYDGAVQSGARSMPRVSPPSAAAEMASRNACINVEDVALPGAGWQRSFRGTECSADVDLITLQAAGHVWPGAATYPSRSRCGGEQVPYSAAEAIGAHFRRALASP